MKEYLQKIESHINSLDKKVKDALADATQLRHFKKGEYLLSVGEVCKGGYLIQKGVARKFYLNEGKEITMELFFENDLAISLQSYTMQMSSCECIQAIEPVTASFTHYHRFQQLKQEHKSLWELDLMITEYYAMWLEERMFQFHTMDASERYQWLLKEQPHVIQQIPLTYIASYLGVSLETLSRIRAKII